ncbi:MAG TPA: hypothetical protein VFE32_04890 [Puia sp.]|jgi:hypothetical protein|nr:hypothetical protein [Puia sp.]
MKRVIAIIVVVVLLVLTVVIGGRYFFVVGDGIKAGTLNYVVKKGYVFKTYEGEMILNGLQSKGPNSMQSNEFLFSVVDTALAQKLMLNAGKYMLVRYKEYNGSVPWRGFSRFVVYNLVAITTPDAPAVPLK